MESGNAATGEAAGRRLADHSDRASAQSEIHARPISPIGTPARVRRIGFLLGQDPQAGARAHARFSRWCLAAGREAPRAEERRFAFASGPRHVVWELHNEFLTFTWTAADDDWVAWPDDIGLGTEASGAVGFAVRLDLIDGAVITPKALAGFDEVSLCFSAIEGGRAQVATDFVLDRDGFTRYEFAAAALGAHNRGIIVRRLLEIETYRVMALIGLPLSRRMSPAIGELEARLAQTMAGVGEAATTSRSQAALDDLHRLQMTVSRLVEETRYRFAASKAYGQILWRRLESLGESPVGEHRTLQRYLRHRLEPALWTFAAIEKRQDALFEQMSRTTALLNARIGLDIQMQNQSILNTISETAQSQFRLQGTVEGLSTIAISYYVIGILGYVLHVFDAGYEHEKALAVAVIAPLVVVMVWLTLRRVQRRHAGGGG